jgi:transposase-like protein
MPILTYLHQLFNAEQCQAYIHTLRWKDRPLQCPRCQGHHVGRSGTYQYRLGCKRYWCQSCKRTFIHRSRQRDLDQGVQGSVTYLTLSPLCC